MCWSRSPRFTALAWLGILTLGCGGSSRGPATDASGAKVIRIGAVLPMFSHPFFLAQKRALEDKAAQLGVAIDVRDGQNDDVKQSAQVEALLNLGTDALILCPRDESALVSAVERANADGVPVVTMNRRVNGGKVVAYVGADDAEGGKAQGRALVEALGPKGGKILYLQGTKGSSPQHQREAGFKAVLAEHPEITIADERFADFQEDRAKAVMTDLVRRYDPGAIRAIVAQSDEMALPAAEVARTEGWKELVVIGFDGMKAAFEAIRAGQLTATVLQDPAEQSAKAVEAAVASLRHQPVAADIVTALPVITRANVDQHSPAY